MGRTKLYANATERQRACRARALKPGSPTISPRTKRPLSRPKRLAAIEQQVQLLLEEYQSWAESMPESLSESGQANMLAETIDMLSNIADLLSEVSPPRGFGRD